MLANLKSAFMGAVNTSGVFSYAISCENSSTDETEVKWNGFNCETIRRKHEGGWLWLRGIP